MICPDCGHDNAEGTRFCVGCDRFLAEDETHRRYNSGRTGPGRTQVLHRPRAGSADGRTGLRVALAPDDLTVAPGETVAATVTVTNVGTLVEEYALRVDGPSWITVEPDVLRVYPGQDATAVLHAAPPRDPMAGAGRGGFRVTVAATIQPGVTAATGGVLTLTPFHDVRAELEPHASRGGSAGRYQVRLVNGGNAPLRVRLDAEEADAALRLEVGRVFDLPPGRAAVAPLVVPAPRALPARSSGGRGPRRSR